MHRSSAVLLRQASRPTPISIGCSNWRAREGIDSARRRYPRRVFNGIVSGDPAMRSRTLQDHMQLPNGFQFAFTTKRLVQRRIQHTARSTSSPLTTIANSSWTITYRKQCDGEGRRCMDGMDLRS